MHKLRIIIKRVTLIGARTRKKNPTWRSYTYLSTRACVKFLINNFAISQLSFLAFLVLFLSAIANKITIYHPSVDHHSRNVKMIRGSLYGLLLSHGDNMFLLRRRIVVHNLFWWLTYNLVISAVHFMATSLFSISASDIRSVVATAELRPRLAATFLVCLNLALVALAWGLTSEWEVWGAPLGNVFKKLVIFLLPYDYAVHVSRLYLLSLCAELFFR